MTPSTNGTQGNDTQANDTFRMRFDRALSDLAALPWWMGPYKWWRRRKLLAARARMRARLDRFVEQVRVTGSEKFIRMGR
jgi:hypothetical protein